MKLLPYISSLALAAGLFFGGPALATSPGSNGPGQHEPPGGGFFPPGGGFFQKGIILLPTSAAPAGAIGEAHVAPGAPPQLDVNAVNLAAGTYSVTVADSTGATTTLGTFAVAAPGVHQWPVTEASVPLPVGFNPASIATVQILDATSAALLAGSVAPVQPPLFHLHATAAAPPGAAGAVQVVNTGTGAAPAIGLTVDVTGLAPGVYTVNTAAISSGATATIGTFTVAAPTASSPPDTQATLPLPAGFDPHGLANVQILDASGTLLLTTGKPPEGDGGGHPSREFHLHPTAAAPVGTHGEADVINTGSSATPLPALSVDVTGLPAGTYTVTTTTLSTAATTVLGTFAVAAPAAGTPPDTQAVLPLPAGADPADLASVQVLDANSVLLLSSGAPLHGGPAGPGEGEREFRLQATPSAPVGARGEAELINTGTDAAPVPALSVDVTGLALGAYTLSTTSLSTGASTAVGTFTVAAPTVGAPADTQAVLPLATGADPRDIASVQVLDATSVVDLSSGNETPRDPQHHKEFRLRPTSAAPAGASGEVQIVDTGTAAAPAPGLRVDLAGLAAGSYAVATTSISTGLSTTIGVVAVAAPAAGAPADTLATLPLPAGLDPLDIGNVQVLDASSDLLLSGDAVCRGGPIHGGESLFETSILTPTATAPVGALGAAALEARNHDGTNSANLELRVQGLAAGTYTVSVTSIATGASTTLGTFDSSSAAARNHVNFGGPHGAAFPAGFNVLDIAAVQISDASGNLLLSGDLTNPATTAAGNYFAEIKTVPGAAAPKSKGLAVLAEKVTRHTLAQALVVTGSGAPANATLTVQINGATAGSVKTNHAGAFLVRQITKGANVQQITSVTVTDAGGKVVLSAHF